MLGVYVPDENITVKQQQQQQCLLQGFPMEVAKAVVQKNNDHSVNSVEKAASSEWLPSATLN